MVLFTHTEELKDKTLEQYVNESSELKKLIQDCEWRSHGFNNNDRNPDQVTQLLQEISIIVRSNRENAEVSTIHVQESPGTG